MDCNTAKRELTIILHSKRRYYDIVKSDISHYGCRRFPKKTDAVLKKARHPKASAYMNVSYLKNNGITRR